MWTKPEVKFPVITNVLHLRGERNLKGRGDKKKKKRKRKGDTNHVDSGVREEDSWRWYDRQNVEKNIVGKIQELALVSSTRIGCFH